MNKISLKSKNHISINYVFFLFFLIIGFSFICISVSYANEDLNEKKRFRIDSVIAIVNDEVITMTDLQRSLIPLIKQLKSNYVGEELMQKLKEAEEAVLSQLIENKLILQTAVTLKENEELKVAEKELLKYIQEIIERFPSKEIFQETLKRENLSFEDFRQDCVDQLLVKKLVSMKVSSKVFVSNKDIQDYYSMHISDFTTPAKITFSQIWLKKDTNDSSKEELIKRIHKELLDGADFKTLAVKYSEGPHAFEGGVWKDVEKGQFTKELDDVIWSLSPGTISEIIETRVSYHILKIDVIEKPREVPIEEVWNSIQNKIYFERAEELRKVWINELKVKAFIQINYEK